MVCPLPGLISRKFLRDFLVLALGSLMFFLNYNTFLNFILYRNFMYPCVVI